MTKVVRLEEFRNPNPTVRFSRAELSQVLQVYSRRVASGEWRDYAIDQLSGRAEFKVFRHAAAGPIYTISKFRNGRGPVQYMVSRGPRRLRQGSSLGDVLGVFDRDLRIVPTGT